MTSLTFLDFPTKRTGDNKIHHEDDGILQDMRKSSKVIIMEPACSLLMLTLNEKVIPDN